MNTPPGYREGPLTVGSLFSGIGGIELGLEWTGGFKTVWQVENDEYATRVLERHWPGVRRWDDVRTFPPDARCEHGNGGASDGPGKSDGDGEGSANRKEADDYLARCRAAWRCDLICGGFPCQDISYAGKGAGLGGKRSGLFYEAARIIRTLGPRYVVLENVSALLTRGIGDVLGTLASLGYDAEWHCIPAAAVGAPHIRDRVFVLGFADSPRRETRKQASQAARYGSSAIAASGDAAAVADANGSHRHWGGGAVQVGRFGGTGKTENDGQQGRTQWSVEPNVGRVAHGIPARVDRLRCLGNAVVPQVAYWIGQRILAMEACHATP